MKIHIVQKGETIWDIAEKYGVDFESVKDVNPQLSSPDMIMPGMKIKIPSNTKFVKHKEQPKKEMQKQPSQEKMSQPKPIPKIDVDDTNKLNHIEAKPPTGVQPLIPVKPSPQLKEHIQKPSKINQQPMPEKEEQTKGEQIKEKQQPQMPSFNELPKIEVKENLEPKQESEPHKQMQQCCCCYQMPHPCHFPSHMIGCYPLPMPYMHPGQMMQPQKPNAEHPKHMMPSQDHMAVNPGYMGHNHQREMMQQNSQQAMPHHHDMEYTPQHAQMNSVGRPFPQEQGDPSQALVSEQKITREPPFYSGIPGHSARANVNRFPQPPLYPTHPKMNEDE